MHPVQNLVPLALLAAFVGCTDGGDPSGDAATADREVGESFEIVPGLEATVLERGHGRAAEPGDYVEVHYTGWLHDESAADARGEKFDSSRDRDERFQFQLGAGDVIAGWDRGVDGMLIGETRELVIAPELAYGARDLGVIPPNSTLVFEVELFDLEAPDTSGDATE